MSPRYFALFAITALISSSFQPSLAKAAKAQKTRSQAEIQSPHVKVKTNVGKETLSQPKSKQTPGAPAAATNVIKEIEKIEYQIIPANPDEIPDYIAPDGALYTTSDEAA
jgi:hypothetical protein